MGLPALFDPEFWRPLVGCLIGGAVALAVGYKDITTFERNFRRCEQLSPVEYRKLQRPKRIRGITTGADESTRIAET